MKPLKDIQFGFSDAENYKRRENRDLFSRIFLKTEALENICQPNVFFLIGEKGTGKTAYAVHLSNAPYKGNRSFHRFIRETDYLKFLSLKRENKLSLSDYASIWKVIIYLLLAKELDEDPRLVKRVASGWRFSAIRKAIDEYYSSAFAPEIPAALQFIENSQVAAELIAKHLVAEAKASAKADYSTNYQSSIFQTNLLYIERHFEEAFKSVKLSDTHILFVDGIDIRPESTSFDEYLDCVKGLANAVWTLNNDVFPRIADSQGRLRVVLLLRPDIFNTLGMLNRNTKLKDNSVVLGWNTKYISHRDSDLFKLADRMFLSQQSEPHSVGECWDHYLPFDATNFRMDAPGRTSFVTLLRYSFHRPRDILSMLDTLYEIYVKKQPDRKKNFEPSDLNSPEFRAAYSDYFLGEIRDSLSFYYNTDEFEAFLKFFEYLNGKQKFTYVEYLDSFTNFIGFLSAQAKHPPSFMRTPEEFLQFLFDLNVICYIEHAADERFFHWCFIDRTVTNISPKVKTEMEYEIHYGLTSALNLGKPLKPRAIAEVAQENDTHSGYIMRYLSDKQYGFLVSPDFSGQLFFHKSSFVETVRIKQGLHVTFRAGVGAGGKPAAKEIRLTPPTASTNRDAVLNGGRSRSVLEAIAPADDRANGTSSARRTENGQKRRSRRRKGRSRAKVASSTDALNQ